MPTLTIKGMPEALYFRLKELAAANRRSLNSEILFRLEQASAMGVPDAGGQLARADAVRESLRVARLTDAKLRAAKRSGRP